MAIDASKLPGLFHKISSYASVAAGIFAQLAGVIPGGSLLSYAINAAAALGGAGILGSLFSKK